MMALGQVLAGVPIEDKDWDAAIPIAGICCDSRRLAAGELYACTADTNRCSAFNQQAAQLGAGAIVINADSAAVVLADSEIPCIRVSGLQRNLSRIAGNYYRHPSQNLRVIGITGTNGKTTLSVWLEKLLNAGGQITASMGTLGVSLAGEKLADVDGMTTRDAVTTQQLLSRCLEQGAETVAMEVSSHGLVQHRVEDVSFAVAVFTNLTRDHLDFHGSEQAYWQAKKSLFEFPSLSCAVVNLDDERGRELAAELKPRMKVVGYSIAGQIDAEFSVVRRQTGLGLDATAKTPWGEIRLHAPHLFADHELSNLCAAVAVAGVCGIDVADLSAAIADLQGAPGRMQWVGSVGTARIYVDYAHTPDAIERTLSALRSIASGRVLAVFGCGGDRDRGKRPLMTAAALRHADELVVTADNPRNEDAQQIIDQMLEGLAAGELSRIQRVSDRAEAIRASLARAQPGDVIAILGKGHEDYQIVGNQVLQFSDVEVARSQILSMGGAAL